MSKSPSESSVSRARTARDEVWDATAQRNAVLEELSRLEHVSVSIAREEAARLGISSRHLYTLLRRYREGDGLVTDLLPKVSSGGRGRSRLNPAVEEITRQMILSRYQTRQKISISSLHAHIADACLDHGLPAPALTTVSRRVSALDPVATGRRRGGRDSVRHLQAAGGSAPPLPGPLRRVEIDHTPIDLIVVDEVERRDIGRPFLTFAIDNYSRCVVGMVVTLEHPSTMAVALCLTHMVADKRPYLERLGVDVSWPMSGKPLAIYTDNAKEFKSRAMQRGAEQHGIELAYRPPGQPNFGGTIERLIGTFMEKVHELPGTTFSNIAERGSYKSQEKAVMTLKELERWLAFCVARYHGTVHRSLRQTPAAQWAQGVREYGVPPLVVDTEAFTVGFLPTFERSISREGFVIDEIYYYSHALRPWIARRNSLPKFTLRRDPRDIGRIWAEDPDGGLPLEVPPRTLLPETMTAWEWDAARKRRREKGLGTVDVLEISRLTKTMASEVDRASRSTRTARRKSERLVRPTGPTTVPPPPADPTAPVPAVQPFEELEDW